MYHARDYVLAYFNGGNAKDKNASELRDILDVIKEATAKTDEDRPMPAPTYPYNPAR